MTGRRNKTTTALADQFVFRSDVLPTAQENPGPSLAPPPVTHGELDLDSGPASGTATSLGEQHIYQVELVAGQTYRFDLKADGGSFDGMLWLADSDGKILVFNEDIDYLGNTDAALVFTAPADGVYLVGMQVSWFWGNYQLFAETLDAAPSDDFANDATTDAALDLGTPTHGTLDYHGDTDWFRVDLQSGTDYIVHIAGLDGNHGYVEIVDSEGEVVLTLDTTFQGLIQYPFPAKSLGISTDSDTAYYISVTSFYGVGDYTVGVYEDYLSSAIETLEIGEERINVFAQMNQLHEYRLTLEAGKTYRFDLQALDSYFDGILYLTDGNGNPLASNSDIAYPDNPASSITFTTTYAGDYLIQAESAWWHGLYELSAVELETAPADDFTGNTSTTGMLTAADGATGVHEYAGDMDWFKVSLEAGISYTFELTGAVIPHIEIFDASGIWLAGPEYHEDEQFLATTTFAPSVSGDYYIAAGAMFGTGGYTIGMSALDDDYPHGMGTHGIVAVGSSVAGEFEANGDRDWFAVELEEGQSYEFALKGTSFGGNPGDIVLYDENGVEISRGVQSDNILIGGPTIHHTAEYGGTYYVEAANGIGSYEVGVQIDEAGPDPYNGAPIEPGVFVEGNLYGHGDWDLFLFEAEEGKYYSFSVEFLDSGPSDNLGLTVYYENVGSFLNVADGEDLVVKYLDGMTYLRVWPWSDVDEGSRDYRLLVEEVVVEDDHGDAIDGATVGEVEQIVQGEIEAVYDWDVFAFELEAGTTYTLEISPGDDNPLVNYRYQVAGPSGLITDNSVSNTHQTNSLVIETDQAGTYHVAVSSLYDFDRPYTGTYSLRFTEEPLEGDPLDAIDWQSQLAGNVVAYYFAPEGYQYDDQGQFSSTDYAAEEWSDLGKAAMLSAFEDFANVTDLTFVEVTDSAEADFILVNDWDINVGGYFSAPGETDEGLGVFGLYWVDNDEFIAQTIQKGGTYYHIILHEIGHGLGLAHPHDIGGDSPVMLGVENPYSTGLFGLNQIVFTMMSYNLGWSTGPFAELPSGTYAYGRNGTLMALDIALLQEKYGANETFASGDDVYALSDANLPGTFFQAIWDTNGSDEIRYEGVHDAVIDLRPATLRYEEGGGGFVSYVWGIHGGYTIASGVVIEKATGGGGGDTLTGNAADNSLAGNGGDDALDGGAGHDTAVYSGRRSDYAISVGTTLQVADLRDGAPDGTDTLASIERLLFSDGAVSVAGLFAGNGGGGNGGQDEGSPGTGEGITPGSTVIVAQPGNDGGETMVHGNPGIVEEVQIAGSVVLGEHLENVALKGSGDYTVRGNDLDNVIYGNSGANVFYGSGGNDHIDGGTGYDRAVFEGGAQDYAVAFDAPNMTVTRLSDGAITTLSGIQQIEFDDQTIPLFMVDHAEVYALYLTFLDRGPDEAGFAFWMEQSLGGLDLVSVTSFFTDSAEFLARQNHDDAATIIETFYQHVLQRPAEAAGLEFWQTFLQEGGDYLSIAIGFIASMEFNTGIDAVLNRNDWLEAA